MHDDERETLASTGREEPTLDDAPSVLQQRTDREGATPLGLASGDMVGRFRIDEVIGEGGFGVVYRAEQTEPVRREVALKVIRPGMNSAGVVARFEAERQALAVMDHPHVARVIDGGVTGREQGALPYFVMEFVRGEQIIDFCDHRRMGLRARIELFLQVCEAVQHAHNKAIIHRDLKPSNILVSLDAEGVAQVKVIDFGIAKALHEGPRDQTIFTVQGQVVGTPEYMSPEQADGSGLDIDTRSDVYSLGVVLYELLTGLSPFDGRTMRMAGLAEILRIIRETEPPRPSTRLSAAAETATALAEARKTEPRALSTLLRGELDWVVMKCLEKDRSRRYDTPSALAAELKRYLTDEPVLARPPSVGYRLGKFVRRRKGPVAAGVAIALLLVAGVIGTMTFALRSQAAAAQAAAEAARALTAERDAEARAHELAQVADFQASQLSGVDTSVLGHGLRADLLKKRRSALEGMGRSEIEVRSALLELEHSLEGINFTNVALELLEEAMFDRALGAIDQQFADQPLVRARLLETTAETMRDLGLLARVTLPQQQALEIRRRILGDDHPDTLRSIKSMGRLLLDQGRIAEAEPYLIESLEGRRRVLGDDHPDTLMSLSRVGVLHVWQGKLADSEPIMREAMESRRRVLGDDHPKTLDSINNMAYVLQNLNRNEEAEPYFLEAIEGYRRVLGEAHPYTLGAMNNFAVLRYRQGRIEDAEPLFREALEVQRRVLGNEHPRTLGSVNNMGFLMQQMGELEEAERLYRESIELRRRVIGSTHPDTLSSIRNLGLLIQTQGRFQEAEPLMREAMEGRQRTLGAENPDSLESIYDMAVNHARRGRTREAAARYREALEGRTRILGPAHVDTLDWLLALALFYREQGEFAEADGLLASGVETARGGLGDHWMTALLERRRSETLLEIGLIDEAIEAARTACDRHIRHPDWSDGNLYNAFLALADALRAAGRRDEAMEAASEHVLLVRSRPNLEPAALASALATFSTDAMTHGAGRWLVEAEQAARESLEIRRQIFPEEHPLAWLRHNVASLLSGSLVLQAEALMYDDPAGALRLLTEARPLAVDSAVWLMTDPGAPTSAQLGGADRAGEAAERALRLFEALSRVEPDTGHETSAAEWRDRLGAWKAERAVTP